MVLLVLRKNTGKTTTMPFFLEGLIQRGLRVRITSIGLAGEAIDSVTRLLKPRYLFQKGTFLFTAKECLANSDACYRILETTGLHTPLGEILFIELTGNAPVVLVGPRRSHDLRRLLFLLPGELDDMCIDGARNRIAPLCWARGIVLSTGASRDRNLHQLIEEARAIEEIMQLSQPREDPSHLLIQWVSSIDRGAGCNSCKEDLFTLSRRYTGEGEDPERLDTGLEPRGGLPSLSGGTHPYTPCGMYSSFLRSLKTPPHR